MKTSVVVAALTLAFSSAQASEVGSAAIKSNVISEDVRTSLAGLSAVEIPAKAAKIVKSASDEIRLETAKLILKEVLNQRPQLAVQMTASIVRVAPETAPSVAPFAAAMVPQFSEQIIRAAAIMAPRFAQDIVASTVRVFPNQAKRIMSIVALAAPQSGKSPVRLSSGPIAQTVAGSGTIVTRSGVPIGALVPVAKPGEEEPELVFFPVTLAAAPQVVGGAAGTDVSRIPVEIQAKIVTAIKEQNIAQKVAQIEADTGTTATAAQIATITAEVETAGVNLQDTLEIDSSLDLSDYTL
ncbi:MAG: hypothetical protein ISQ73_15790 [Verrucomicrobiae bacterium]|nr:hypothetical protein [Verrucomicrobiae bacterium]